MSKKVENKGEDVQEDIMDSPMGLESLLTEGTNIKVPIKITLPDGRSGGVLIRPISNAEFTRWSRLARQEDTSVDLIIAKNATYTLDEKPFPKELFDTSISGVVSEISKQIGIISGIRTKKDEEKTEDKVFDKLLGFSKSQKTTIPEAEL